MAEMVDRVQVSMWAFRLKGTDHEDMVGGERIPGPGLISLTGDRIRLRITNSVGQGGRMVSPFPASP
jgi:hypothetical protein